MQEKVLGKKKLERKRGAPNGSMKAASWLNRENRLYSDQSASSRSKSVSFVLMQNLYKGRSFTISVLLVRVSVTIPLKDKKSRKIECHTLFWSPRFLSIFFFFNFSSRFDFPSAPPTVPRSKGFYEWGIFSFWLGHRRKSTKKRIIFHGTTFLNSS